MRGFLVATGNRAASRLRSLPVEMKEDKAVLNQLENHWVPMLILFFGSLERFLLLLPRFDKGRQALEAVIQSGSIDKLLQHNIEPLVSTAIQQFQRKSQQVPFSVKKIRNTDTYTHG